MKVATIIVLAFASMLLTTGDSTVRGQVFPEMCVETIWWDIENPPWWASPSKANFEAFCDGDTIGNEFEPFVFELKSFMFGDINVAVWGDDLVVVESPEHSNLGRQGIKSQSGEMLFTFDPPATNFTIYISGEECSDDIPGLYCYDILGQLITGDCQNGGAGCTTFGPPGCEQASEYQWYFGQHETIGIDYCFLLSEGREISVRTMGAKPFIAPSGGPGGGGPGNDND